MKSASISEAKNSLSALIERVKRGQTVLLTDRNKPVAKIVPIESGDGTDESDLREMARHGLIHLPRKHLTDSFFRKPRPKSPPSSTVLQALLDERSDDR